MNAFHILGFSIMLMQNKIVRTHSQTHFIQVYFLPDHNADKDEYLKIGKVPIF